MFHAPNLPIDFPKMWEVTFEFRILGLQSSTPECADLTQTKAWPLAWPHQLHQTLKRPFVCTQQSSSPKSKFYLHFQKELSLATLAPACSSHKSPLGDTSRKKTYTGPERWLSAIWVGNPGSQVYGTCLHRLWVGMSHCSRLPTLWRGA